MRIVLLFMIAFFPTWLISQKVDATFDSHSAQLTEQDSDSIKPAYRPFIDLGQLLIDFDNNYDYLYYGPNDLYLMPLAHPRMGIEKFIDGYMYSLFIHPKYVASSVSTSLRFTVYSDGSLGNFTLGAEENENDTLYVEAFFRMGNWIPSKSGEPESFKLTIISKDRIVDKGPQFLGGPGAFNMYVKKNLRFPISANRLFEDGHVTVEFFVEADGSITGANIVKGLGPAYDREVLRIINTMPKWIPGTQNGIPSRERVERIIVFEVNLTQKRIKR